MKPYLSIPVEEARSLAAKYGKQIVIINAWDQAHQLLHTVTYGQTPADKLHAARAGDLCAGVLGMDLERKQTTEDFRTVDAARNAQLRDLASGILSALRSYQFGNVSPDLAKEMADTLEGLLA